MKISLADPEIIDASKT